MIAYVKGILTSKHPTDATVETGGLGYRVFIPVSAFERLPPVGSEILLHTYLHVREDALQLYGFLTAEDKDFFLKLTDVSGIGPRLALGILSGARVPELRKAIESEDIAFLSRIPGLGKKTATKLVFELRGKLPPADEPASTPASALYEDALSALINLGYRKTDAEAALARLGAPLETLEGAIMGALKLLSRAIH